jgi:cell division protein FtsB
MVSAGRNQRRRQVAYGGDQDEELTELHKRFAALEEEARVSHDPPGGKPAAPGAAASGAATARRPGPAASQRLAETQPAPARKDVGAELKKLDDQITSLRRKHDELAHANMTKRRELDKMTGAA